MNQIPSKRPWRKLVKKLQRKRRRQKLARHRDKLLEEAELEKLKDPLYNLRLEEQETIIQEQQLSEENERKDQEQLWLRREQLSQKQFERDKIIKQAEEAKLEAERFEQGEKLRLLEEARLRKLEEIKMQTEKAAKDFDDIMTCMQQYLEDPIMKTPTRLECSVQTRPDRKPCDFYDKTNCCRFGTACTFNHKKPMLAKIIFIKNFFQHPLLEQQEHDEYSRSDSELEFNERDLRDSYDEFCEDVWSVLEEFGKIINFRTVRNVQAHLRGHVFVEYAEKRSALKAFINLQGRYYASKRLNVEFSNIRYWRTGVCGMRSVSFLYEAQNKSLSLDRKCPKGVKCNFLHLMKNIDNKYNKPINNPERSTRSVPISGKAEPGSSIVSRNFDENPKKKSLQSKNWRWSESPEIELKTKHAEVKFINKTNYDNSPQRKTSRRRSKSNSPDLSRNKISRKHLMKNIDNKYSKPINNPERSTRSVSTCGKAETGLSILSCNFDENPKKKSLQSSNWRWSESPEIELKTKNAEVKFTNKTSAEKNNSPQRKTSHRRSRSNSPDLRCNKIYRKRRSQSPCFRHHNSEEKSCFARKLGDLKDSKAERKTIERKKGNSSNSKRRKSSHKKSTSPNLNQHESTKRKLRSKSPLTSEKKKTNKKTKRHESTIPR